VLGRYLWLPARREVIIEAAQANGLVHLAPQERDPLGAHTAGVGDLILDALSYEPRRILVGVGGSATTDGGAGMAAVLGAHLLDADGRALAPYPSSLLGVARIEWRRPPALEGVAVVVATDVENPLVGPNGAAAIYGPQKGASPEQVTVLDRAMARFAAIVERDLAVSVAEMPGAGAAGGLAAGLIAFLGATVASGFDVVAEATGFAGRLAGADLVITGEGRFDGQSISGKGCGRVIMTAQAEGKRAVVLAGSLQGAAPPGVEVHTILAIQPDADAAMQDAAALLEGLAATWASGYGE
jgi:glycerate kinase